MSDVRYIEINNEDEGQRLDNYLIRILKGVPKSRIYKLIRNGEVRLNKKRAKPATKLVNGDVLRVPPVRLAPVKSIQVGHNLSILLLESIIHEDQSLIVINKPAGIAVHGGSGLSLGVIEGFRKLRPDLHYLELVHRLDKETSGCLLLAKKRSMLRALHALLESRDMNKTYWALLDKAWDGPSSLQVDVALERNVLKSGERMVMVKESGKSSLTTFKLMENFQKACFMEISPKTGRTHQIRVHGQYLSHPVLGDEKYGGAESLKLLGLKPRLYLHAQRIQFTLDGKKYDFQADLDDKFNQSLETLREGDLL